MSGWDWLPVGLAAWFVLSVVVALIIGPVLRQCSERLEEADENFIRDTACAP